MPFILDNLQPIGGQGKRGRASQHWSYWTLDATATVDTSGYFNEVANLLSVGDVIHRVSWSTAIGTGTISTYGTHIVNAISAAGVVDVTDTTAGSVTDTD